MSRQPPGLHDQMRTHGFRYRNLLDFSIGFVPWIGFFVVSVLIKEAKAELIFACVAASILAVLVALPIVRFGPLTTLDLGSLIFFPLLAIAELIFGISGGDGWSNVLASGALTAAAGCGLPLQKPFTAVYSRASTPEVLWRDPGFLHFHMRLTRLWFSGLLAMTVSLAFATFFPVDSVGSVFFGWLIPIAAIIYLIREQIIRTTKRMAKRASLTMARLNEPVTTGGELISFLGHVTATGTRKQVRLLHQGLASIGLVEAWAFQDAGRTSTGGIRLGNFNIEFIGVAEPTAGTGLSFEPTSLKGLAVELDRRGLSHGPLENQLPGEGRNYFQIGLPNLSSRGSLAVRFDASVTPVRSRSDMAPRNDAGILWVSKIVVGVSPRRRDAWKALLRPLRPEGATVHFGAGPDLEFVASEFDGLQAVVVTVADVDHAASVLRSAGLTKDGNSIKCGSLRLILEERTPAPAFADIRERSNLTSA